MAGGLRRRLAGIGTAVLVGGVAASGCAPADDHGVATERPVDFSATVSYLSKLVDDSDDDNYRFTASTVVHRSDGPPGDGPRVSGVVDARRAQVRVDIWSSAEAMAADVGELAEGVAYEDQFFEAVFDADSMFLRAPLLTPALGQAPLDGSLPVDLVGLGTADGGFYQALADGWVTIDVPALGDVDPGEAAGRLAGIQNLDPQGFLDLLESGDEVDDLGTRDVDGVVLSGLSAQVDYVRALRVQGFDVADLASLADTARGATVPVEVWVDGDGMIRRVVLDLDLARLPGRAHTTTTIEFADYGDGTNEVELPAGAVDMTDVYLSFENGVPDVGPFLDLSALDGLDTDIAALEAEAAALDAEAAALLAESEALDAQTAEALAEDAALNAEIEALEEQIANLPPPPEPVEVPPELMEPPPTLPPELLEPVPPATLP